MLSALRRRRILVCGSASLASRAQVGLQFSACPAPRPQNSPEDPDGKLREAAGGNASRRASFAQASTSGSPQAEANDRSAASQEATKDPSSVRWQAMQQALRRQSRPDRAASMPSLEEVQQHLRAGDSSSCTSSPRPEDDTTNAPTWQEVLRAAQAADYASSRDPIHVALTDTFGRRHTYLRISLTERCNLRCLYCMPEEGAPLTPSDGLLTVPEILRLTKLFVEAGVSKIRLTGGEPTLRPDIVDITAQLHALPGLEAIGMTTNGIALRRSLAHLRANGLTLLNLSLDTLRADRFERMTRRRGLQRVLDTIEEAITLGYDPVKVNVVVMRGQNDDELPEFVEMTRDKPINVRFIEYMPFDGNVWSHNKMVSYREMVAAVTESFPQGLEPLQDARGEVARNFRVPGFRGSVSFITSMTKAFCSDCNRLRLMADGNLKVCLFGANEVSLRDAMREGATDEELLTIISAAVNRKRAAHAGMFELARAQNRAMVRIGG